MFKYLLCVSKDGDFGQKISLKVAFILASWGVVNVTFFEYKKAVFITTPGINCIISGSLLDRSLYGVFRIGRTKSNISFISLFWYETSEFLVFKRRAFLWRNSIPFFWYISWNKVSSLFEILISNFCIWLSISCISFSFSVFLYNRNLFSELKISFKTILKLF